MNVSPPGRSTPKYQSLMCKDSTCPKCGTTLGLGTTPESCPACLLGIGLEPLPQDPATEVDMIAEKPGDMVGRYLLMEQIGEGGFGVVFRAEQRTPVKRAVALKVVKPGMDSREVVTRFEAERQALALMDHPNIAKVYDAGTTDLGRPYFVMEHVEGQPLTTFCDGQALNIRERLALFVHICEAVQHAHQKGVIHRDLKPSNVLVCNDDKGNPCPKVIDFGVAKAIGIELTEKTLFTMCGRILGTPMYMSPEQAGLHDEVDVDTRGDIYSLGVILYELLTGHLPLGDTDLASVGVDEMRRRIREEEPLRPSTRITNLSDEDRQAAADARQIDPAKYRRVLSGDLDWIVMRALEKDRNRRYDTAQGFAMDVRRHLDNLPVSAGPPQAAYRIGKFVLRHRAAVGATVLAMLTVITALVVGGKMRRDAANEEKFDGLLKQVADLGQRNEEEPGSRKLAIERLRELLKEPLEEIGVTGDRAKEYRDGIRAKLVAYSQEEYDQLLEQVDSVGKSRKEEPGSRQRALETLRRLANYSLKELEVTGEQERRLRDEIRNELVACLAWTDLEEEQLLTNAMQGSLGPAALHSSRKLCALGAKGGILQVWNLQTGKREQSRSTPGQWIGGLLRISPDGSLVAAGSGTPAGWKLVLWDWEKNADLPATVEGVNACLDFHPAGNTVAVGAPDGKIVIIASDGTTVNTLVDLNSGNEGIGGIDLGTTLRFSPDGQFLAVGTKRSGVMVIETGNGTRHDVWRTITASSLAWSPDGKSLVVGDEVGALIILERGVQREHAMNTDEHSGAVDQLDWSSDGRLIASGCRDEIRLWDGRQRLLLCRYNASARTLRFSTQSDNSNPSLGPVLSAPGTLSTLKISQSRLCHRAAGHPNKKIIASTWAAEGTVLVTAGEDGLRAWNREGQQLVHEPNLQIRPGGLVSGPDVLYLATPQGIMRRSISTAEDKLSLGEYEVLNDTLRDSEQIILNPSTGPLGSFLAVTRDTEVVLLDPVTGAERHTLKSLPSTAFIAVSPDGKWLAGGSSNDTFVRVWNLDALAGSYEDLEVLEIKGPSTVAFYPKTVHPVKGTEMPRFLMTGNEVSYRMWTINPESGKWVQYGEDHLSKMANDWERTAQMVFSPRGTVVAVTYDLRYLQVLNPITLEVMTQPGFDEQWPLAISNPWGRWMATEGPKGHLFIWDLAEVRKGMGSLDWPPDVLPAIEIDSKPLVRP